MILLHATSVFLAAETHTAKPSVWLLLSASHIPLRSDNQTTDLLSVLLSRKFHFTANLIQGDGNSKEMN